MLINKKMLVHFKWLDSLKCKQFQGRVKEMGLKSIAGDRKISVSWMDDHDF